MEFYSKVVINGQKQRMFGVLGVVLLAGIVICVLYVSVSVVHSIVTSHSHLRRIMRLPGRESPHLLLGHVYDFPGPGEAGLRFLWSFLRDFPVLWKIQYGPLLGAVSVHHYKSTRPILRTAEPKPTNFGGYKMIKPWLGDGLLIAGGEKWSRNRRLLTPAFHFDILKPYVEINNHCAEVLLDKINAHGSEEYMEVFTHVSLLTLDIILQCAFSYHTNCQITGKEHPYIKAVGELSDGLMYRVMRPWLYPDWIFFNLSSVGRSFKKSCDYVHTVAEDIISKRRKAFVEHGDSVLRHHKYIDFLDILLKATDSDGQGLSDLDIRNEVDTFLFEGHDTTSSGISWTLYSIAGDARVQAACRQEVYDLLSGRDNHNITWEDLSCLPYITMCIKESLRLHCPVPIIQRLVTKDTQIDGHTIPANTMLEINLYLLHHNPDIWENPYEFTPERFTQENLDAMDPYQYVPFSAGPRNCIGQNFSMHEMKIVIARILNMYSLHVDPDRPATHEIKAVMKTENGMYVKFTPRDK